jgi:hypothetical protein
MIPLEDESNTVFLWLVTGMQGPVARGFFRLCGQISMTGTTACGRDPSAESWF